jgi:putative endonuclease
MMPSHDGGLLGYLLANKPRGTLYVGVTNDLVRRIYEHRERLVNSFATRYGLWLLVYFERHESPAARDSAREEYQALVAALEASAR